jgi:hypothetical protein
MMEKEDISMADGEPDGWDEDFEKIKSCAKKLANDSTLIRERDKRARELTEIPVQELLRHCSI